MIEAMFYSKLSGQEVRCELCNFFCIVSEGQKGRCSAYINLEGELFSLAHERPMIAELRSSGFAVYPGRRDWLSTPVFTRQVMVSTPFCNFKCPICNNKLGSLTDMPLVIPRNIGLSFFNGIGDQRHWESIQNWYVAEMTSRDIVDIALSRGCDAIRFAYNEVTIFFEYALEIAKLAKQNGLEVWIETNGYLTTQAVEALSPYLDIAVIGFKASGSKRFYEEIGVASIDPIFAATKRFKDLGVWTVVNDLLTETDDYDSVYNFCEETVRLLGSDQRVFLEVCVSPAAVESRSILPFEERTKTLDWALAAAVSAGLRDVLVVDSVPPL